MRLATKILIGLVAGIVVGLILSSAGLSYIGNNVIQPFGDLFIRLLSMLIVPLVFSTLVVGASNISDVSKLGWIGGKTIVYYLGTTAIAITIGVIFANIFVPGAGVGMETDVTYETPETPGVVQTLLEVVPTNPVAAMAEANMLQIIVFALFAGICITLLGQKAESVKNFFDGFANVMYRMTAIIMEAAPYGVFALIVPVVTEHGASVLLPLLKVIIVMYAAAIIHALVTYSTAVKTLGDMSPIKFFRGIMPATLLGFSSCSSSGTLPMTMRCADENLGVSRDVSSFALPLGATINMDGSAIYQGVAALFIAQVYGLDLSLGQQLVIVVTGTLASIGAAGVPGAGLIILTMVLQTVGLPLDGIALIAGIDRILDMARTGTNVTGDGSCAVVVSNTEAKRLQKLQQGTGVSG